MLNIRTNFLTPGWDDWIANFEQAAAILQNVVPTEEVCSVIAGEIPPEGALHVIVERQSRTFIQSGWQVSEGDEGASIRYERVYEGSDPTPQQVVQDVRSLLAAPKSQARRVQ